MSSSAELGDFLRSRRARLQPAKAGLVDGKRRRTPGLRREEVAERAGISTDWYVRLEQGRMVSPSRTTVDALARGLELNSQEHAHLRQLAGHSATQGFVRETVPETIRRIVAGLSYPAYVTGQRWDVLAWNDAAVELFCDFGALPEADRKHAVVRVCRSAFPRTVRRSLGGHCPRHAGAVSRRSRSVGRGRQLF